VDVFTGPHSHEKNQPDNTRDTAAGVNWIRRISAEWSVKDRSILTATDMEDTSRNSPNYQRSGLRPSREYLEQDVDNIFLSHKDGDEKVGDDSKSNLSGVRLVCRSETNEDRHVGRKGYAEKSSVDREEHISQVANGFGMRLFDVLFVQVTFPVEALLLDSSDVR
jgi:hypothetical protein